MATATPQDEDEYVRAVARAQRGATGEEIELAGLVDNTRARVTVSPLMQFPARPDSRQPTTAELRAAGLL
jgi:hypothetical protein